MDNAPFHKRADFQHIIEQQGHLLEFIPPYSPNLNPIEHKWAQAKALRRQKNVLLTSYLLSSLLDHFILLWIYYFLRLSTGVTTVLFLCQNTLSLPNSLHH